MTIFRGNALGATDFAQIARDQAAAAQTLAYGKGDLTQQANAMAFQTALNMIITGKGLGKEVAVDGNIGPNTCAMARSAAQSVGVPGFVPKACPATGGGTNIPGATFIVPPDSGMSSTTKWALIGGGVLVAGIIGYRLLKRRS